VTPRVEETFWVNMIGKGYPAPYNNFRWCTDRMKIQPTTGFITETISKNGEVMLLLGARKSESSTRGQVMSNRNEQRSYVSRHTEIPSAMVFTPIEDWNADDVWSYVLSSSPPWGGDNNELVTMYRNAQAGECPLVIDKSTPSCGGGRFGCWTCTVVQRDRSMEAMIDNGEDWMQPMLDFRDWLVTTQDPEMKPKIREHRRRTGRIDIAEVDEGGKKKILKEFDEMNPNSTERKIIWGPFTFEFRKEILGRLLEAEKEVRQNGPDSNVLLIQPHELHQIRQLWIHEEGDWEDSLPQIYRKSRGEDLDWVKDDLSGLGGKEKIILEKVCTNNDLPAGMLVELINLEKKLQGQARRSKVYSGIETILSKDWRTREEALAEIEWNLNKEKQDASQIS
jgi:DNA sulfur modification protein DndC